MARIMGIINVTPDSFWSGSRVKDKTVLKERVRQMISQGADAIDIGGCSTRPGSLQPSEQEEMKRLEWGLATIREFFPDVIVSVDTYRPRIAEWCIREWRADIINDVYGGCREMYDVVASSCAQYVLTWAEDIIRDPIEEMKSFFADSLQKMDMAGVDVKKKVILDPGYGFGKTLVQNYTVLAHQSQLKEFGLPILVGLSRKSMAWKLLGITPDEALPATVSLNTLSLMEGADWLRVHDVMEAAQAIMIIQTLNNNR